MRRIVGIVLVLVLMAATTAYAAEPIVIGAIGAITGSAAMSGEQGFRAITLAEEDINAAGGILGRPVKFIFEESKGLPTRGDTDDNKL